MWFGSAGALWAIAAVLCAVASPAADAAEHRAVVSPAAGAAVHCAVVSPEVETVRAMVRNPPASFPRWLAGEAGFVGNVQFDHVLDEEEVRRLGSLGVRFFPEPPATDETRQSPVDPTAVSAWPAMQMVDGRWSMVDASPKGRRVRIGTIYPARISWDALAMLRCAAGVVQIESEPLFRPTPPLDQTKPQAGVPAAWDHLMAATGKEPGAGVRVASIDAGIDVFHPAFFRADGGYYAWVDGNQDGLLTPSPGEAGDSPAGGGGDGGAGDGEGGADGVDLDGDGAVGAGEGLSAFSGLAGAGVPVAGAIDFSVDWLYVDLNGNGVRDAGISAGFTDADPAFGEPVFILDDVDRDGAADPLEKLVRLGTSKIERALVKNKEYVFGKNLTALDPAIFNVPGYSPPDASHGTAAAGEVVGNTARLSKYSGVAPAATLIFADYMADWDYMTYSYGIKLNWAKAHDADVLMLVFAGWGSYFMDGSDLFSQMLDTLHNEQGMVVVVPAGNLATVGKHMQTMLPKGQTSVPVEVPATWPDSGIPFKTDMIAITFYFYGAETDVESPFLLPGGANVSVPPTGSLDTILPGGLNLVAYTATSTTGLVMRQVALWAPGGASVPAGMYDFELKNTSGQPVEIHGFIQDNVSGWSRAPVFKEFESNTSTLCHPATATKAVAVAAFTGVVGVPGFLLPYSSRGPRIDGDVGLDLAAPDDPMAPGAGHWQGPSYMTGGYYRFGGTSGAAPHVAGAAALLKQEFPEASADDLVQKLRSGADKDAGMGTLPNGDWGFGKLDAHKAATGDEAQQNAPPNAVLAMPHKSGLLVTLDAGDSSGDTPANGGENGGEGGAEGEGAGPGKGGEEEGTLLFYRFDFEYDGVWDTEFSEQHEVEHLYPAPGVYVAKVGVRDDLGAYAEALLGFEVADDGGPECGDECQGMGEVLRPADGGDSFQGMGEVLRPADGGAQDDGCLAGMAGCDGDSFQGMGEVLRPADGGAQDDGCLAGTADCGRDRDHGSRGCACGAGAGGGAGAPAGAWILLAGIAAACVGARCGGIPARHIRTPT